MVATGLAGVALVGCQFITGINDLRVVPVEPDGSPPDSSGVEAAAGGDGAAAADGGRGDAQILGGGDGGSAGTADSSAPDSGFDVAACTPAPDGGHLGVWTPCVLESQIPQSILNCVDYCASLGSCCATDCIVYRSDSTSRAAEFTTQQGANCTYPSTQITDNTAISYLACSNSPLVDPRAYFKCCCGP
jgi:hypothetical protein